MSLYQHFARIYSAGPYTTYSQNMAELLPGVLARYQAPGGGQLLDIACGEGTFAVAAARQGWQVSGVDQSADMLALARERATQSGLEIELQQVDMRQLDFDSRFDLATCWYDSLNYILKGDDLQLVFQRVARALKPRGWFIFDMNTLYGLAVVWQRQPSYVEQESADLMEIHENAFDYEQQIASQRIIAYTRKGELWERMEEIHQERSYPLSSVDEWLKQAGFELVACLGDLRQDKSPEISSPRVWYILRKGN